MTVQSISNNTLFGREFSNAIANPAHQSVTVSTSGHKIAPMVQAPKTGNIINVMMTLSSTVSGTVTVTIETIDPTNGNPTGTLVDANATQTITITGGATPTTYTATFPGNVPVTRGQFVALVLQSNSTNMLFYSVNNDNSVAWPCTNIFTGTWAKNASCGAHILFGYDDGTFPSVCGTQPPVTSIASPAISNATNPKIIGNLFTPTFNCKISGFSYLGQFNATHDFRFYDSDGTTLLASGVIERFVCKNTGLYLRYYMFTSEITLTKNTAYRLVLVPTSTTAVTMRDYVYASVDDLNNSEMGAMLYKTESNVASPTGNGDWTNTNTRRNAIWPVLSALDDGIDTGGGGGGVANKRVGIFGGENFIRVSR